MSSARKPVRTAVFPVAGRGTRFLPATKAMPKEMLPIVDKPLIQYAVEEAVGAGATRLVFITGSTKRSIEDHFDRDPELERALESTGKQELLDVVRGILPAGVSCVYIRQGEPLGLGHAVLCARPAVGDEPFYVHLPDDLIRAPVGALAQMRARYEATGASVLAVENVPQEKTSSYGIVDVDAASRLRQIVEKPHPSKAPSTLAVVGRYLLTPAIFDLLEQTGRGAGGEIQLTDGIAALLQREPVHAFRFEGRRYDCGSKLGYIEAIVDFALEDATLSAQVRAHIAAHQ
ncbi:MAG: UTP--glucose-1-phosphate uridylyltransferase GalU [Gammaproteobacteria bacterium]|nr:UTP--glucose-1-phosphate uridylyltransferase GalU [Gammaproteobacteria bacterium]